MNYKKLARNIYKVILYIVMTIVIIWIGFFVYLAKPYIVEIAEVRTTGKPETVTVYWGSACGEEFISEGQEGTKLVLVVPEGGITPADTKAIVNGNKFSITGYRYKRVVKNIFTGDIKEKSSQRFDLVKWHVEPPYEVYVDDKDVLTKRVTTPLGWETKEFKPKFFSNIQLNNRGC